MAKNNKDATTTLEAGRLYTNSEAASYLHKTPGSMSVARHLGRLAGLPVIHLGAKVLYRGSDLEAYLKLQTDDSGGAKPWKKPRKVSPGRPRNKRRAAA